MRVIAGTARGKRLRAPREAQTRPTSDLAKGALFDMLEAEALKRGFEPDDEGRMASGQCWPRVLDLFAGSGALGIEALSRGAAHADFVDHNSDACRTIQANLRETKLEEGGRVHRMQPSAAVARLPGPYDAVLLDPPYASADALRQALGALARDNLIAENGVVMLEHARDVAPPEQVAGLPLVRRTRHGRTGIALYA